MTFAPFDGVLLDDPRDPVPGAVAISLHHRVERAFAAREQRPPLNAAAMRDRAAVCHALMAQGLLPDQLHALGRHGLMLESAREPGSIASLIRHLQAYLEQVERHGYLEPYEAMWRAASARSAGQRGFWIERQAEDGPLDAGLRELVPARLRVLCLLPELGAVRFRLPTQRGAGRMGLFDTHEPHLVRQLLPALEAVAAERGLEHFELEAPEGWAENPWGTALDTLFEGPLPLDEEGRAHLRRALLPTEAAVWRAAVEQICAWIQGGLSAAEITLVHPDPAAVGPMLAPLLAMEGVAMRGWPGRPLKGAPVWGPVWQILTGLWNLDPAALGAGLATSSRRSVRVLAAQLAESDQAGELGLRHSLEALSGGDRSWVEDRWAFLWNLRTKVQPPARWLSDVEAVVQRFELLTGRHAFYPPFGLLQEAWAGVSEPTPFRAFLEELEGALETMRAPNLADDAAGVRLLAPDGLESEWTGSHAVLLLDLGEGVWPAAAATLPELDGARMLAINRALRAQSAAGEGAPDFPSRLQAFILPQVEENETLPRAFHRDAHAFNRALALARQEVVALSAERDANGQLRAQGPFWHALNGAGAWRPTEGSAHSRLRWRWESAPAEAPLRARQEAVRAGAPGFSGHRCGPVSDCTPGVWDRGGSAEHPLAPTLLEGLARCPFRVLSELYWKLDAWREGGAHVLQIGTLVHRLMEAALVDLAGEAHWPSAFLERHGLSSPAVAAVHALLASRWRDCAGGWVDSLGPLHAIARERLRLAIEDLLPSVAAILVEDLQQPSPTKEELAFLDAAAEGPWLRELVGLEYRLEPCAVTLPDGSELWVHGTVDRLERWTANGQCFLRIVDYKLSRYSSLATYRENDGPVGAHLQLPLYQALLEQQTQLPVTALLVSLKEPWRPIPMMLKGDERARLMANLGTLLARARRGDFPAVPGEHCASCGLSALCGHPVDVEMGEEVEP